LPKDKKVLILSNSDMIFHRELKERLIEEGINVVTMITNSNSHNGNISSDIKININGLANKIPKFRALLRLIKSAYFLITEKYDILNLHYVSYYNSKLILFLKKIGLLKNVKIVLTFYGSDFYRISDKKKKKLKPVLKGADKINFTNEITKNEFDKYYNGRFSKKLYAVSFGLNNLNEIKKAKNNISKSEIKNEYNIPRNKIVIACGYNAIKEQQHEKIIEELSKLTSRVKSKITLFFLMSYGKEKEKRICKVRKKLQNSDLDFIILDKYLRGRELAKIRILPDIMINMQTTDQFSGSMQEHIFAGNYVITGSWLPYGVFIEKGIELITVDSFIKLKEQVEVLINDIENNAKKEKLKKNKDIIWQLSSWENNINKWIDLYFR